MLALGLDVGNAKIKLCAIDDTDLTHARIEWGSSALPFTRNRTQDFTRAVPERVAAFLRERGLGAPDRVVVASSHSYSFSSFETSIEHLVEVLAQSFDPTVVFVIDWQRKLTCIDAVSAHGDLALTNAIGSIHLGSKLIEHGVIIDVGTTSTEITPVVRGHVDPAWDEADEPSALFRHTRNRLAWLGVTRTPLALLDHSVTVDRRTYPLTARPCYTDVIMAVLRMADDGLWSQHAYAHDFPSADTARQRLAHLLGVDRTMIADDDLDRVAWHFHERLVLAVADRIRAVVAEAFDDDDPPIEAATFGLGESVLAAPALAAVGFEPTRVKRLMLGRDDALYSASSAFGLAVLAVESLTGEVCKLD